MMTIRAMTDGKGYSERHLEYNDYLDRDQKIEGQWIGKGAETLGLTGTVSNDQFERLRECEHPDTGEFLRQRKSADRHRADGSKQSDAVNFYDFTLSAPKSVSTLGVLEDPRLLEAHRKAATKALGQLEQFAAVEDQRDGKKLVRETGNLAIATYQHDTSRRLDPNVHTHAVVFNMSYDKETGNWKALDARGLYQRRAMITECYRTELARLVMELGYEVENRWNKKGTDLSFEIKGFAEEVAELYSKRSAEKEAAIETFTEKKGRTPSDNEVSVLVRGTREDALQEIATAEVRQKQRDQLTPEQAQGLRDLKDAALRRGPVVPKEKLTAAQCLEFAKEHIFERVSVAHDFQVLEQALQYGRGQVDADALKTELRVQQSRGDVIGAGGKIATRESLQREQALIAAVNRGNGRHERWGGEGRQFFASGHLTEEQKTAVEFILNSRDTATCLQGAAGTGKTEVLRDILRGLREAGTEVAAFAPSETAVNELRQRVSKESKTLEYLLQNPKAQEAIAGKAIILDEAAMVSARQMAEFLAIVERQKARVLFVGDNRQTAAVEAGDALQILQDQSKLKTARISKVQRQTEPKYRQAAETLWKDREAGFNMLLEMDAIKRVDFLDRPAETLKAVLEAKSQKNAQGQERSVMVVAPTHTEIDRFTETIRDYLKHAGKIGGGEKIDRLQQINWTAAQRKDTRNYKPGQVLMFHKPVKDAQKNESFTVVRVDGGKIVCRSDQSGKETAFTQKQVGAFGVYHREKMEVLAGDQLLLQANRKTKNLTVRNGEIAVVRFVDPQGRIHLADGRVLPVDYRQMKHGYAVTAQRSQSGTVDAVIVTADQMEGRLFYTAVTRGRELVKVLTSDLTRLKASVMGDDTRQSATELAREAQGLERKRERHSFFGRARVWAKRATKAWQQKLFRLGRNRDTAQRRNGPQQTGAGRDRSATRQR
jgi:conjugative relaxase-like TrwC/TraI family protein